MLDGKKTSLAKIRFVSEQSSETKQNTSSIYEVEIHEGMKRQIRRMFEAVGFSVLKLKRISFAGFGVSGLEEGSWRYLSAEEVRSLAA